MAPPPTGFGALNTTALAQNSMTFSGAWGYDPIYAGMSTHSAGSRGQIQFHGSQIFVYGGQSFTSSTFELDGDPATNTVQKASSPLLNPFVKDLLYKSPALDNADHVLTITNGGGGVLKVAHFIFTANQDADSSSTNSPVSSTGSGQPIPLLSSPSSASTSLPASNNLSSTIPSSSSSSFSVTFLPLETTSPTSSSIRTIPPSQSSSSVSNQTAPNASESSTTGSKDLSPHVIPAIVVPIVVLSAIIGVCLIYWRRKKRKQKYSWFWGPSDPERYSSSPSMVVSPNPPRTRTQSDIMQWRNTPSEVTRAQSWLRPASSDSLYQGSVTNAESYFYNPVGGARYPRDVTKSNIFSSSDVLVQDSNHVRTQEQSGPLDRGPSLNSLPPPPYPT